MRIVVLVKEVPDTYGQRRLSTETGLVDRSGQNVVDEISERALEVALAHADENDGVEVVALSMGPASATTTIRKALAMGAGSAVHIVDDDLVGADLGLTAQAVASWLAKNEWDLVVAGNESTDGASGMLPAMLAEHLGVPHLSALSSVTIGDNDVEAVRASDDSAMTVRAKLPAVLSITEQLPDPRLANFKGIMAAKKKPLTTVTTDELGVDGQDLTVPRAIMLAVTPAPPREAGTVITDEGDGGTKLAEYLIENKLV